jgi:cyclic pyranopterin phosphate synthase
MARWVDSAGALVSGILEDAAAARIAKVAADQAARGESGTVAQPTMKDGFGRRIEYLRISVTDKCNLRCVYCMPLAGLDWLPRADLLSYEEIAAIVRTMAAMGLRRIRLTGGEPLVRRDVAALVRMLHAIDGIEDIALSTNAVLLAPIAQELKDAGVSRLNISLDSLQPARMDALSRRPGSHTRIFEGLAAAEKAGFDPIKINAVIMRGRNDDEIEAFARITAERPWHVRFIEVMPTGDNLGISADEFVPATEMLARLQRIGSLEPVEGPKGNGPATYFRFAGGLGTVGVITPMSHNYCERCNRMRLTADGQLRPCLFGEIQTNLRDPLRSGSPLEPLIEETLRIKPERHFLIQGSAAGSGGLRALSQVGG